MPRDHDHDPFRDDRFTGLNLIADLGYGFDQTRYYIVLEPTADAVKDFLSIDTKRLAYWIAERLEEVLASGTTL